MKQYPFLGESSLCILHKSFFFLVEVIFTKHILFHFSLPVSYSFLHVVEHFEDNKEYLYSILKKVYSFTFTKNIN